MKTKLKLILSTMTMTMIIGLAFIIWAVIQINNYEGYKELHKEYKELYKEAFQSVRTEYFIGCGLILVSYILYILYGKIKKYNEKIS